MLEKTMKVNLPYTPFPMEAKLMERLQPEILQKWRAMNIHQMVLEDRRNAETFILHDGPPYAAGETHIGIGFNKVLKDMIVKFWSMLGRRVPFVPGWDCHGLPIEAQVRAEVQKQSLAVTPLEMRERCREHAESYIENQKELFQLLGVFGDWDRPYLTMSPSYEAGVLEILSEINAKGYIYSGLRPVYWCHICESVLAEAEVEMIETHRPMTFVQFPLTENKGLHLKNGLRNVSLNIQIKELWTLPAGVAVAVNPESNYTIYASGENAQQGIISTNGNAASSESGGKTIVGTITGKQLEKCLARHPVTRQEIPVILDETVGQRSSTGIALVTPSHYMEDYKIAGKFNLKIPCLIDNQGRFNDEIEELAGQNIYDAEQHLLKILENAELVSPVEFVKQPVAHGSRCEHSIITKPSKQWFIAIDHRADGEDETLRRKALKEVGSLINWIPQSDQTDMHNKIEERPDWCISRQRAWGIPIPSLICLACGEVALESEVIQVVRDLVAVHGSDIWYTIKPEELLNDPRLASLRCRKCGKREFDKDPDFSILDIWFESGASWRSALINDYRLDFPADLCVEGTDQHRGWFQLSLLTSLIVKGQSAFKTILTHGFVLDEKRRAMSKRYHNFISLKQALENVPADLLRLYFIWNKNTRQDFPLSMPAIFALEPEYRTFRNSFRFLLGNLHDFVPSEHSISLSDLNIVDKWILCRFHRLINDVTNSYSAYQFRDGVEQIYSFCKNQLSNVYFETAKDRLYNDAPGSADRRSAQTTMHSILMGLVKILAPVLVYTCEEVWSLCPGIFDCSSVHLSLWPSDKAGIFQDLERSGDYLEADVNRLLELRRALQPGFETARRTGLIGNTTESVVTLYISPDNAPWHELIANRFELLRDFLVVSEVRLAESPDGLQELPELKGVFYRLEKTPYTECIRCRRYDATVSEDKAQPSFCARCVEVFAEQTSFKQKRSRELPLSHESRPEMIADFLVKHNIRKVALLNENGQMAAYYFHLPSQQVRTHPELKPIADYVFNHPDFKEHSAILLGLGAHTDVLFGIGIHQLKRGTPLGGTREFSYEDIGGMLENLLRLSYGMSIKNAIGQLPHGGGKSIIDTCGLDLKIHRELRRRIYRDFGQFTASLFGRYICAEDMNNTSADTREMLSCCRHVMCLPEGVGGGGNPSRFTSLVGWLASKIGWKHWRKREGLEPATALDGAVVSVQGVGNVGFNLIDILTEAETNLKKILVADTDPGQIERVRKLLRRKGKEHLIETRAARDPIRDWDRATPDEVDAVRRGLEGEEDENTYILYSKCDILFPSAVGKVINAVKDDPSINNVDLLDCKVIVPIANNAYSDNDLVGELIWERGIIDVVEGNVNWGGATVAASELYGYDEDHVIEWCMEKVYRDTDQLLETAQRENVAPWKIKRHEAEECIKAPHPIVETARAGKFILDISDNFSDWIKSRWLPNITSAGSEAYAAHVAEAAGKFFEEHEK